MVSLMYTWRVHSSRQVVEFEFEIQLLFIPMVEVYLNMLVSPCVGVSKEPCRV